MTRWAPDEEGRPPRILTEPRQDEPLKEPETWGNAAIVACPRCGCVHWGGERDCGAGRSSSACLLCGGGPLQPFRSDCTHVTRESIREGLRADVGAEPEGVEQGHTEDHWCGYHVTSRQDNGCTTRDYLGKWEHPLERGALDLVLDTLTKRELGRLLVTHAGPALSYLLSHAAPKPVPPVTSMTPESPLEREAWQRGRLRYEASYDAGDHVDALATKQDRVAKSGKRPLSDPRAFEVGDRVERLASKATANHVGAVERIVPGGYAVRWDDFGRSVISGQRLRLVSSRPFRAGDVVYDETINSARLVTAVDGERVRMDDNVISLHSSWLRLATPDERKAYESGKPRPFKIGDRVQVVDHPDVQRGVGHRGVVVDPSECTHTDPAYSVPVRLDEPLQIDEMGVGGWAKYTSTHINAKPAHLRHATPEERKAYESQAPCKCGDPTRGNPGAEHTPERCHWQSGTRVTRQTTVTPRPFEVGDLAVNLMAGDIKPIAEVPSDRFVRREGMPTCSPSTLRHATNTERAEYEAAQHRAQEGDEPGLVRHTDIASYTECMGTGTVDAATHGGALLTLSSARWGKLVLSGIHPTPQEMGTE